MSLVFIARGYVLAAPSARLSQAATLLALADLDDTCLLGLFGVWVLGRRNYACIWLAKFPLVVH